MTRRLRDLVDDGATLRVVAALYREATLTDPSNPPLAEWLRVLADTMTDHPDATPAAVVALVLDGTHTRTWCQDSSCGTCAGRFSQGSDATPV
jgi:ferredoxin